MVELIKTIKGVEHKMQCPEKDVESILKDQRFKRAGGSSAGFFKQPKTKQSELKPKSKGPLKAYNEFEKEEKEIFKKLEL